MAEVSVFLDTDKKSLVVKLDDKVIPNVGDVSIGQSYDPDGKPSDIYFSVRTYENLGANTTKVTTYCVGANSPEQERPEAVKKQIERYISRKLK